MTSYTVSAARANFEAIEAAEIALGRTWAMQNLVRRGITAKTWDMYCADDEIERTFWGGDWRPANRFEAIGIAEQLAASDLTDRQLAALEADWNLENAATSERDLAMLADDEADWLDAKADEWTYRQAAYNGIQLY